MGEKIEPCECSVCKSDADCRFPDIDEGEFYCQNDSECPLAITGFSCLHVEDWNAFHEQMRKIFEYHEKLGWNAGRNSVYYTFEDWREKKLRIPRTEKITTDK